jgi:hypothetical protein
MIDIVAIAAVLIVVLVGAVLLVWFTRRHTAGWQVGQRPIAAFQALLAQSDRAVETGRGIHMSLGRADLGGQGNPAGIAALEALDIMAKAGARSDTAPISTVGDGALLLAAQDSLRAAHLGASRAQTYRPDMVRFISGRHFAMSYAAGVSDSLNRANLGSHIMLGRFGTEIAIMAEAGERLGLVQVIGSDDPQAMAIGLAVTDKVLVGEELFAAGAYLQFRPAFLASLQLQDVLRVAVIVILLLVALLDFIL